VLPLEGLRVVEFAHMVMGPSCGLVLADLGADVVKVEPLRGDNTRRLEAAGAGFFPVFNRNKKSLAVDLARPEGKRIVLKLLKTADVLTENFRPELSTSWVFIRNSHERKPEADLLLAKRLPQGPVRHRLALDEVTQMMGGLAYMTGLPDRPLRAGSSVIDIMGGNFCGSRRPRRAARARDHRDRYTRHQLAFREYRLPGGAAHGAVRAHREAPPPMSVSAPPGASTTSSRPATAIAFSSAS